MNKQYTGTPFERAKDRNFLADEPIRNVTHAGKKGYMLNVRLTSYRSLPLSCVDNIELTVDGTPIEAEKITFVLNGYSHKISELGQLSHIWWNILDHAGLFVESATALQNGKHKIYAQLTTVEPYVTGGRFKFFSPCEKSLIVSDDHAFGIRLVERDEPIAAKTPSKREPFKVGISFHSFAQEYCANIWSLDDLMALASNLGKGVEIVGPSNQRGFPFVTDEFERTFKSALERYELIPTSYGSYADPFMLPDRNLSADEIYAYTVPQLIGAAKLGFPVVRLQHFASVAAEKLVPLAERLKIKMGYELHTPLMIESDRTQELLAQIKQIGSDALGLIPDCGIFSRSIARPHIEMGYKAGMTEAEMQKALDLFAKKKLIDEAVSVFRGMGANEPTITWIGMIWDTFGYSEPADLSTIKDHIIHFHGKFFNVENGEEPDLRYEEVVKSLLDIGYTGWMSSEFEGKSGDSLAQVIAHQEMVHKFIKKYL